MEFDPKVSEAIDNFFAAIAELKQLKVIRSDRYLGDIGEYICQQFCDMELSESGRHSFDGIIVQDGEEVRCEVKYHNSSKRTNIKLGNPDNYDILYVVLGSQSKLRSDNRNLTYVYKFTQEEVRSLSNAPSGYYFGKGVFQNRTPIKELAIR